MTDAELYELKSKYKAIQAEIKALDGPKVKTKRVKTAKYVSEPVPDMLSPETLAKLEQLKDESSVTQKQAEEAKQVYYNMVHQQTQEVERKAQASPQYTIYANMIKQVAEREKALALPIPIGSVWKGGRYGGGRLWLVTQIESSTVHLRRLAMNSGKLLRWGSTEAATSFLRNYTYVSENADPIARKAVALYRLSLIDGTG